MNLVDARGRAEYGCFDGPLTFNVEDFKLRGFFGQEVSALRKLFALGGFSFIGIVTGDLLVGMAAVKLGYAAHVFGFVHDFGTGQFFEAKTRALPSRLSFPMDADQSLIQFEGGACSLRIEKSHSAGSLAVEGRFGSRLRVKGLFCYGFAAQPLRVVNPSCGDPRRFTFTENCAPLPAQSISVLVDGIERAGAVDRTMALYDWSAGYFNRNTNWLWSALAGVLDDGTPVGANFAALVNESFYPENAFWIGAERIRVSCVIFQYDEENPEAGDWRIFTEDGQVELRFHPLGERSERTWLPFVRVNFRQFLGEYSGKLGPVELKGLRGLAEIHLSVW